MQQEQRGHLLRTFKQPWAGFHPQPRITLAGVRAALFQNAILRCLELLSSPSAQFSLRQHKSSKTLTLRLQTIWISPPVCHTCCFPPSQTGLTSCLWLDTTLCLAPCFAVEPASPFQSRELSLPHHLFHPRDPPKPFVGRSRAVSSPT